MKELKLSDEKFVEFLTYSNNTWFSRKFEKRKSLQEYFFPGSKDVNIILPRGLQKYRMFGVNLEGFFFKDRNLNKVVMPYSSFIGADLKNADFSEADLKGANFNNANLCGANFSGADLRNANFRNANLQGANFTNANLSYARFNQANLVGAIFIGTNLACAEFYEANLSNAILYDVSINYKTDYYEGVILDNTVMINKNLNKQKYINIIKEDNDSKTVISKRNELFKKFTSNPSDSPLINVDLHFFGLHLVNTEKRRFRRDIKFITEPGKNMLITSNLQETVLQFRAYQQEFNMWDKVKEVPHYVFVDILRLVLKDKFEKDGFKFTGFHEYKKEENEIFYEDIFDRLEAGDNLNLLFKTKAKDMPASMKNDGAKLSVLNICLKDAKYKIEPVVAKRKRIDDDEEWLPTSKIRATSCVASSVANVCAR